MKWCADVESRLKAAKEHALSQTADIDALFKTLDDIGAEAKAVRLDLDRLVKRRKDEVKEEAVIAARRALAQHVESLNAELSTVTMQAPVVDFAGAIKGLRSIASMQDALDTALANGKIAADAQARVIRANRKAMDEADAAGLFPDFQHVCTKPADDFANLIANRRAQAQARLDAERERIRAEEAARVEREAAQAKAREEADAKAKADAEAKRLAELNTPQQSNQQVLKAEAPAPDATDRVAPATTSPSVGSMGAGQPADAGPAGNVVPLSTQVHIAGNGVRFIRPSAPPADTGARIKLGDINAAISPLAITADGLAALGFPVVATDKTSKLYRLADMPAMLAAMVAHIQAIQAKQAA